MDLHVERGLGQGVSEGELSVFSSEVSTSVDASGVNLPRVWVAGMPLTLLRSVSAAPLSSVSGVPSPKSAAPPRPARKSGSVAPRPASRRKGLVVTPRDELALQFTSRYQYATTPQLGAYLGMSPSVSRRRMPKLAAAGLFTFESVWRNRKVWMPTASGVCLSGLDLTVPQASIATARHCLGLVDLGIGFEQAGEQVVTERELRGADDGHLLSGRMSRAVALLYPGVPSAALIGGPPLFAVLTGNLMRNGKPSIHTPDMVLARPPLPGGSPGSIAIELELTRKTRSKYQSIFASYARAPHIGLVVYYTDKRDIASVITACATAMNLGHFIRVKKYVPSCH